MKTSWTAAWREALARPGFRARAATAILSFALFTAVFSYFVSWVEARPGAVLRDPVLTLFTPRDLGWVIFTALYGSVALTVYNLRRDPERFMMGIQTWALMILLRMTGMYLTPLDAPEGIIPLVDPFAQAVFTTEAAPTKDLFFSGHTSTMTVLILAVQDRRLRGLLFGATIVIVVSMMIQRVHYSVDVFAAPFFVFAIHRALLRHYPVEDR
ncbi:sphingomyelin synthase family protein [Myxococcota bacterium]|nr:sphingomyelin synthase family protein [Myxococcota bacterium]